MFLWAAPRYRAQLSHQFLDRLLTQLAAFYRTNRNLSTDHLHSVLNNRLFFKKATDGHALTLESLQGWYVPVKQIRFPTGGERPIRTSTERILRVSF